jgi:hypothetical protein
VSDSTATTGPAEVAALVAAHDAAARCVRRRRPPRRARAIATWTTPQLPLLVANAPAVYDPDAIPLVGLVVTPAQRARRHGTVRNVLATAACRVHAMSRRIE